MVHDGSSLDSGLASRTVRAQHVVGGQAERVEGGVADEREAEHLDAAGAGQGAADPAAQPLLAGQPAAGGSRGSTDGTLS